MKPEIIKRILSSFVLIPIALFFIIKGSFFFTFFIGTCFVLITLYEWHMMSKKKKYNIFGFIFLIFSFYSVYFIRNELDKHGLLIFLFILLICVSTDIGGYIFGKLFKGPKLTKISPKKTYAGVFGGYFLSIIFTHILINYSELFKDQNFGRDEFVFVLIISTVSQVGDIIISYFKRLSKIKDTGKLIPGHGGILDRIDGMLFAFPFYFIFYLIFY
ncbi:MAG: phosphatidate cytidylyltransferase [Candidatus Pelagibacter sp.]